MNALEHDLPRREPGLWLNSADPERTQAGCHVCDFEVEGSYESVRALWLAHVHDPLYDIKTRLTHVGEDGAVMVGDYLADVQYLLRLLEERK